MDWPALPFGVTSGPPYFQEMMLDHHGGHPSKRPSLLASALVEQEAYLDTFMDDVQKGTGDALDIGAWNHDQAETNCPDGFTRQLAAVVQVLEITWARDIRTFPSPHGTFWHNFRKIANRGANVDVPCLLL